MGFGFGQQDRFDTGTGQYNIVAQGERLEKVVILFMFARGEMVYNRQNKVLMFIPDHEIQSIEYVVQP